MAHLHLGLLAYWVVNTIRHQLKLNGIHNEWRDIVRTMNTQKLVTTTMKTQYDEQIIIRQCSEPTPEALNIYNALKYKHWPFTRKKSVVPRRKKKILKQLIMSISLQDSLQCGLIGTRQLVRFITLNAMETDYLQAYAHPKRL